ncbi:hypothetical protein FB45DRAFT_1106514 [Roridomyces roridus]|uniref:Uncharacterized protein n=1 Tax=Roridomyces roridus TaxID=1738132 RepID=A0AAD7FCJ5_9AGAR|nr:hypothetical protein FB45DRAFT_1106514 [Roridomyces roridus]
MTVVKDQMTADRDTAPPKFKVLCEDLEACLHDVLSAVKTMQVEPRGLRGRFREVVKLSSTADRIVRYQSRIRDLRSNAVAIQTPTRINTCPPPSRIFQGRQTILDQMHDFFSDMGTKQRVFLLHGLGGAGKTQIALTFIEEECSLFSDLFFIDASTQNTIEAGLSEIAGAKTLGRSHREALQWLRTTQEKWLLFFDNADDPKLNLNAFLPRGRHGNVLITSRNPGLSVYAGSHHRVSDMEEEDAVPLLLTSAAQDDTPKHQKIAGEIVKELSYLPLAIVQAGAFISRSGDLDSYLSLYRSNKARLLNEVSSQSHDDYAMFYKNLRNCISQQKGIFQKVLEGGEACHARNPNSQNKGISEKLFSAAADYQVKQYGPTKEEVGKAVEFLGRFKGSTGAWDSLPFMDVTNELRAYSLINYDAQTKTFSIHPLVHAWSQSTVTEPAVYKSCMTSIIGMQVTALAPEEGDLAFVLLPHIDMLLPSDMGRLVVVPPFNLEYGLLYYYTGRFAQAEKLLVPALATRRAALGDDHFDTLVAMNHLATTYLRLGRLHEAESIQSIVVEKGTLLLGPDHPYIFVAIGNLAVIYTGLGRYEESLSIHLDLLEKEKKILGENHLNTLAGMRNLGSVYALLKRFDEAEEILSAAVEKTKNIRGEEHPDTLHAIASLAVIYMRKGRLEEALELQSMVLRKQEESAGEDPERLTMMADMAVTYREMGRVDEGERLEVQVLQLRKEVLGEDHPETLLAMVNLAWTCHVLGRFEEAERLGVEVLEKQRAVLGDFHPDIVETMQGLMKTFEALGKTEKQEELRVVLQQVENTGSTKDYGLALEDVVIFSLFLAAFVPPQYLLDELSG